jgi:DNA modification methylase
MEPSPDRFVANLVEVFREVRRVLRDDGLLFLNIGDTYAAERGATAMPAETIAGGVGGYGDDESYRGRGKDAQPHRKASAYGLKHKDLVLVPARLALALQADGWWVRNDIIWATPNPMPESVTDRFTSSYEHVLMLAKSDRYYFDQDAVREPHLDVTLNRVKYGLHHKHPEGIGVAIPPVNTEVMGERFAHPNGRNRRDVWTIPTVPYKGAHYATFPTKLVDPMVLASTSEKGVCPECGAPWRRVTERIREARGDAFGRKDIGEYDHGQAGRPYTEVVAVKTVGWMPTCEHDAILDLRECPDCGAPYDEIDVVEPGLSTATIVWQPTCAHEVLRTVPAIVLDPFAGSGTVGKVAQDHNRRAILIDLNPEYLTQQLARNSQMPLGLGAASE